MGAFDNLGTKVERGQFGHGPERGGWLYQCDGMPTQRGCSAEMISSVPLKRIGKKSTGWLVCYGLDFYGEEDRTHVLIFCPACAVVVELQQKVANHQHVPVQHRDGKPPWCKTCGLTAQYTVPVSRMDTGRS